MQITEDIQEECGKYGKILAIVVPRPSNPATSAQVFGQGSFGKVSSPDLQQASKIWQIP